MSDKEAYEIDRRGKMAEDLIGAMAKQGVDLDMFDAFQMVDKIDESYKKKQAKQEREGLERLSKEIFGEEEDADLPTTETAPVEEKKPAEEIKYSSHPALNKIINGLNKLMGITENPFSDSYLVYGNKSQFEFSTFDKKGKNEIELKGIMTIGEKGKGFGTKAIKDLTKVADENGTTITLYAKPFGIDDTKLGTKELINFYKKNGFEVDMSRYDEDWGTEKDIVDYAIEYNEGVNMIRQPKRENIPIEKITIEEQKPAEIDEEYNKEVDSYKWFVIDPETNKAISGFEYKEDAKELAKEYEKNMKIVSVRSFKKMGIEDPRPKWKGLSVEKVETTLHNKAFEETIKGTEYEKQAGDIKPSGEAATGTTGEVSGEPKAKEQYTHTDAGFRDESDARDAYEQRGDKDVNQTYEEFLFSKACGDF